MFLRRKREGERQEREEKGRKKRRGKGGMEGGERKDKGKKRGRKGWRGREASVCVCVCVCEIKRKKGKSRETRKEEEEAEEEEEAAPSGNTSARFSPEPPGSLHGGALMCLSSPTNPSSDLGKEGAEHASFQLSPFWLSRLCRAQGHSGPPTPSPGVVAKAVSPAAPPLQQMNMIPLQEQIIIIAKWKANGAEAY